jgi:hypothetical protein
MVAANGTRASLDSTATGHSTGARTISAGSSQKSVKLNGKKLNGNTAQDPASIAAARPINGKLLNNNAAVMQSVAPGKRRIGVIQDRQLVDRCLAGEVAAWSTLYQQCHDALLKTIRLFLGQAGNDTNLVEEIAARTWYALVKDDGGLLGRFDSKYGCRLTTFLSFLAKNEARLLLRSERRIKIREHIASRREMEKPASLSLLAVSDEEFIATLSPAERSYCLNVLFVANKNGSDSQYTQVNQWQLRHRIRRKLEQFLR